MFRVLAPLAVLFFFALLPFSSAYSAELPIVTIETGVKPEIFSTQLPEISSSEGVRIVMDRTQTRPGERWLRGQVKLAPSLANGTQVRASVFGFSGNNAIGTAQKPSGVLSKVKVNLRGANLDRGRLRIEVLRGAQVVSAREVALDAPATGEIANGTRIPVSVDVEAARVAGSTGVTFGVPFAAGALWDVSRLAITDAKSTPIAAQITPVAWWHQDGSVKWARVDALYAPGSELFVVVQQTAQRGTPSTPVVVQEAANGVTVRIGSTEYSLGVGSSPIRSMSQGGKVLATATGARGLYVVDQKGQLGTASQKDTKVTVESRGPVEATIKIEGPYLTAAGQELARHSTRVSFYANQPQAQISHTFIISQPSDNVWFKEIGWELNSGQKLSTPQAVFNTSAADWKQSTPVALAAGQSASMAQVKHYRFLQGKNKFTLTKTAAGASTPVSEGEESGDWAALSGSEGGFLFGTRDAARRHPKEFAVSENTLNLLLFSPKGGSELDFRSASVAEDIGVETLIKRNAPRADPAASLQKLSTVPSNAQGWAKTHGLVLSPIAAGQPVAEYAKPAALMSRPAQALSAPDWLYQTRVLGALHPYAPQEFPEIENYVERTVAAVDKFGDDFGEYGFRDYEAGPHFIDTYDPPSLKLRRWHVSYSVRSHLWYLYARRGQRSLREFAEGTARAYHDNFMTNWNGEAKTRGLFTRREGADNGRGENHYGLPFYWGAASVPETSGTSDLEMFLLDYYLTGNRRAYDAVEDYGEGMKQFWKPGDRTWRHLRMVYNLTQAYTLNWDEELGDLARASANAIVDEDAALNLFSAKSIAATYKTHSDFLIAPFVAEVLDDPRYERMADKLAEYWRDSYLSPPLRYGNPDAFIAHYLYEKTADPALAESMAIKLRQLKALAEREEKPGAFHVSSANFLMHGFALAQDLVKKTGAWKAPVASFSGMEIFGATPRWYVQKPADQRVVLRVLIGGASEYRLSETVGTEIILRPVGFSTQYNHDLYRVMSLVGGAIVELPKEAPAGVYELSATHEGRFAVIADSLVPLMTAVPGPWQPLPEQSPMPPIYFQVAADSKQPKLSLAGRGRLTAPDGKVIKNGDWVTGDVPLTPGAWKLQLEKPSVVRSSGFTPLFASDRAANLFALPEEVEIATEFTSAFTEPTRGIRLTPKDSLVIEIPEQEMRAGTVEFYYQPASDVAEGETPRFLSLQNTIGRNGSLTYIGAPENEEDESYYFQSFIPIVLKADAKRTNSVRGRRRHYFLPGRWNHLAFVWGIDRANHRGEETTTTRIFVDGKRGTNRVDAQALYRPDLKLNQIIIGPGLDGTIAGVRISKNPRYNIDFEPPAIGGDGWKDTTTLAAWSLSSTLEAEAKQGAATMSKTTRK